MSMPEKMTLPASLEMLSWTSGIGKLSFLVMSLRRRQSTHHLILPFFFFAATRLKLHGLSDGSITSCLSQLSNCSRRSGSRPGLTGL